MYTLFEILATVSDVAFLCWFVPRFLNTELFCKKNSKLLILPILLLSAQFAADYLFPDFDVVYLVVFSAFVIAFSLLIRTRGTSVFKALLGALIFIVVEMLVNSIVHIVFSFFTKDSSLILQGGKNVARVVYLTVCVTVRFLIFKILLLLFHSEKGADKISGVFTAIYLSVTVAGLGILMDFAVRNGNGNAPFVLATLCFIVISSVFVLLMFRQAASLQRKQYELSMLNERLSSTRENFITQSKEVMRIRHDQKNFLLGIKANLNAGNIDGVKKTIDGEYEKLELLPLDLSISNVFRLLVEAKNEKTGDESIEIICDFQNLDDIRIPAADVAVLLGNALDNAIEATQKIKNDEKKTITLATKIHNQQVVIVVKNPVEARVDTERMSTRKDPATHGYGVISMKKIAGKYGGDILFESTDKDFTTSIILINPTE